MYMPSNHSSAWALRAMGWNIGWVLSPAGFANPARGGRDPVPFSLDNGLYHAPDAPPKGMKALPAFYRMLDRIVGMDLAPLWVVSPDVPYHGDKSLPLSVKHFRHIRDHIDDCPIALAVQDGMEASALDACPWAAVFVAGSDEWKDATLASWCHEAKGRGMAAHIARVNTWRRMRAARLAGADSADGTSWGRGRRSQIVEVLRELDPSRSESDVQAAARIVAPREVRNNLWTQGA